jgi:DNA-binding transcriptional MocR family regulator
VAKRGLTERGADLVQLVDGMRHALEVGTLRVGERVPMVRALARELTVAPNTVVKRTASCSRWV